jgi:hypothetical protein
MLKVKQTKDQKTVAAHIPRWEAKLADLQAELALAQKRLDDHVRPLIQQQLADKRPIGIPTTAGQMLPVAPFLVLDKDEKREEIEQNIQRLRAEVQQVEDKLRRFREFIK